MTIQSKQLYIIPIDNKINSIKKYKILNIKKSYKKNLIKNTHIY